MHQVEAIITWKALTLFEKIKISDRLILEQVASSSKEYFCYIAYVAVEDEPHYYFNTAKSYLDLFVLTCALASDISATYRLGVGIKISDLKELGEKRVTGFEKVTMLNENIQLPMNQPILLLKKRFCELEEDRQEIINSYLGLVLRYYYFALQAYDREQKRIDEMIIDYAISLEAFIKERRDKSPEIIDKLSRFIAEYESKSEVTKIMKNFYSLRNDIVHGNKKPITLEDLKATLIVKRYIKKAIDKALYLKLYEKIKLIKYLES